MSKLQHSPKLGHISTFGGNPVVAAASLATLNELTESNLIPQTLEKEKVFKNLLKHSKIKEIRGKGLMLALQMESSEIADKLVLECSKKGLILFWLLFEPKAVRISPPLTISEEEITKGCTIILNVLNQLEQ